MSFNKIKSASIYLIVSLLSPCLGAQAQSANCANVVPPSEAHVYSALNQTLATFQASLDTRPQSASATPFAAKLDTADASHGMGLLTQAGQQSIATQLSRYQQLGVQGVVIHAAFPMMTPQFFAANPSFGTLQQYSAAYKQIFLMCHQAGMKVMVETHPPYPLDTDTFSTQCVKYTKSLSESNFASILPQHNANVAALGPDFISIVNEPNTDWSWSNKSVYESPTALAAMVASCTKAINAANPQTVAAAGAPNWQRDAQTYDSLFYQIPGLGAIDTHIYFAGNNELEFATTLADNARAAGKQVVVSESWLGKSGEGSPPYRPGSNQAQVERAISAYSFWQPLDAQFIYSFFKWSNVEQPTFFTFFYSQLLFADLPYNQYHAMSDANIVNAEMQAEKQAINADQFTSVGLYYSKMLKAPRAGQY